MTKKMCRKTEYSQSYTTFFGHSAVLSAPAVLLRKFPNILVWRVPANLKFLAWGLMTGLRGYASHGGIIQSRGLLPKVALGYPRYLTSTKPCSCYFFGLILQYVLWSKVLYFDFFE